jgi:hypothetical protein
MAACIIASSLVPLYQLSYTLVLIYRTGGRQPTPAQLYGTGLFYTLAIPLIAKKTTVP